MTVPPVSSPAVAETSRFVAGALCGVATIAIWAGWLVMMRLGITTTLAVVDLTALRFAVAGLILLPVVARRGLALDRLGWPGFLAIAIGNGAPYALVVGAGLMFAPVAHASAYTQGVLPLTVAILAGIFLKERLSPVRKAGLILIVGGALAIGGVGLLDVGGRQSIGHLLFLAATVLFASYTVAMRRAGLDGLHAAAIAAVASLFVYLPIYLVLFGGRILEAPLADIAWQAFYQGVLAAIVSLVLYGRAVMLLGASSAGSFIALGPVMAALLAIPALGEWPKPVDWLGIVVITVGVYLASGGPLPPRVMRARR
jgi:drug/metabolite transporter (DMT)-like permease